MSIDSIKHNKERVHIPSKEEAGYEQASEKVNKGKDTLKLPKNPVVHRGQDPELFWKDKYENDEPDESLDIDIRSLYRHEHVAPEKLIAGLYKVVEDKNAQPDLFSINDLFGNALEYDELEKVSEYYQHSDGWTNRLIQGDSLLVMASLLEREGMAGQVQTIYMDPPYGIKYGSNWQMKLSDRNVKDGSDEHLTGEPEQVKAFRDTWELGIHSYLSYLRDRLLVARELLTDSGSVFVQISDENVHLVRSVMDEVFGSGNFVSQISFNKSSGMGSVLLPTANNYIIWYAKKLSDIKYNQRYKSKIAGNEGAGRYNSIRLPNGTTRPATKEEKLGNGGENLKLFTYSDLTKPGPGSQYTFIFNGNSYRPEPRWWGFTHEGLTRIAIAGRMVTTGKSISYIRFLNDFPAYSINNVWTDIGGIMSRSDPKIYVVQTSTAAIINCILMTTDPGDLVLDPTCGSGTTAFVAEQWGRRWITTDTSRIALNIAKQRLMTATFPYYKLYDEENKDIRQGFEYKTVPHVTLKAIANNAEIDTIHAKWQKQLEPMLAELNKLLKQNWQEWEVPREPESKWAKKIQDKFANWWQLKQKRQQEIDASIANNSDSETLYDQPFEDKKKLRVSGPFTVETLQSFEPINPENVEAEKQQDSTFEESIFAHLKSAGVKNGIKNEQAIFIRVEHLADSYLHAEGFYPSDNENEKKAYFHIGPKFGTVTKQAVNQAIKACRQRGDADWLIILGFSFESDISNQNVTMNIGTFEVTKVRMHDDLLQAGLLKKDKKAASFITIGEPDVKLHQQGQEAYVEIQGLDIYDPIKDIVKARNKEDIAYWMVDTDYDDSNFVVRQVFFCGGKKSEFKKWQKGLENLTKTKRKVERTLKIEIDEEAFDKLYGFKSHRFAVNPGQKIAVRVISQFGEESTKVIAIT